MHLILRCLLLLLIFRTVAVSAQPAEVGAQLLQQPLSEPRNVILIIGDGMDDHQITIARNYLQGARGRLLLDDMPVRSSVQVLTVTDNIDGKPLYVADSANTATSMATGEVTSRGRIATSAGDDKDLTTIVELAAAAGFRSGIVTSASVTDATAAAFFAHVNFRLCENPTLMADVTISDIHLGHCKSDMKAAGGKGSIAEQLAQSPLHVILGGGAKHFSELAEADSKSVLEQAKNAGFHTVSNRKQLLSARPEQRLLGLFSPSTMPVKLQGQDGRAAEEPNPSILNYVHPYLGDVTLPTPMTCEKNPEAAGLPSLQDMTEAALTQLSLNNSKGFFLMIESASIDKQAHERKPCGSIGEVQQLEDALASALAFAEKHPRTLILVTADHAQAAQLIPDESLFAAYPIPLFTPGKLARIVTPEGGRMAINYATSNFFMEEHTGAAIPLFSNSEGAGRVPTYLQQIQLFTITRDYLGI